MDIAVPDGINQLLVFAGLTYPTDGCPQRSVRIPNPLASPVPIDSTPQHLFECESSDYGEETFVCCRLETALAAQGFVVTSRHISATIVDATGAKVIDPFVKLLDGVLIELRRPT